MHGLKTELERCLKKSREKSQTIARLQTELKACKNTLDENNTQLEEIRQELSGTKVRHLYVIIIALRRGLRSSGVIFLSGLSLICSIFPQFSRRLDGIIQICMGSSSNKSVVYNYWSPQIAGW